MSRTPANARWVEVDLIGNNLAMVFMAPGQIIAKKKAEQAGSVDKF